MTLSRLLSFLLLCCVPHSFSKKVSFSTTVFCDGRTHHAPAPQIQDGLYSTCFVMKSCLTTPYTLRVTLDNASYISTVRIASEPLPRKVYYVPVNEQALSPSITSGNVQEYVVDHGPKIHSIDITGVTEVCEVAVFDTENEDTQRHRTGTLKDTQKEEHQAINYALYVGPPVSAILIISIIIILVVLFKRRSRRNMASKTTRQNEENETKRSSAYVFLNENSRLNTLRVPVEYDEVGPPSTANDHEYMDILWDRSDTSRPERARSNLCS